MIGRALRRQRATSAIPEFEVDVGEPLLPLIRLRVDYTGFSTMSTQRFGQKFVGKIANPTDVLHWHKAAPKKVKVIS